jgi:hypothetical protein
LRADCSAGCIDVHSRNGNGAECRKIDAESAKVAYGFVAYELAANFVLRASLALDQNNLTSRAREMRGNSAAGDSTANDERLHYRAHAASQLEK